MDKKAQGISLNVIIIAAIALIVLIVLVIIFTGRAGTFNKGLKDCHNKNGLCLKKDTCTNAGGIPTLSCSAEKSERSNKDCYCCLAIPKDKKKSLTECTS